MNPGRSRWLLRLGVVLIVGLLALFWAVGQHTRTLTIENRSEQSIPELKISLGDQVRTFHNVKAGEQVTAPCPARAADRFTVKGRLANGNLILANGRIGDSLDFVLLPGGLLQERRKASR
ncbi:MAG: hypothetical protein ACRELG_18810 [Gemmataceae bacterium]